MSRDRVVILGGGFAGLACANGLDARRFAVTLVDTRRAFEFLPNIHELVSGVKKPAALRLPLAPAMKAVGHRFIRDRVSSVDPQRLEVALEKGGLLTADRLVVALGAVEADFGISGVGRHTLGFKSVDACQAIHKRLDGLARQGTGHVAIIGGGLEGVEALGEVLRRYRSRMGSVTLIEAREQLLPGTEPSVDRHLRKHCEDLGVQVVCGDPVARITPKTVFLASGQRIRSDATSWTGGPAPAPLLAASGLAPRNQWIPAQATLEHREFPDVFVAGDAANPPGALRKQAYHALDMGTCVAENLERRRRDRRLKAFHPSPKPTLVSFGDIDTILIRDRATFAGPAHAPRKEAVYTAVMAGLDQRSPRERVSALFKRGQSATHNLLWPALRDLKALQRQTRLKRLA